MTLGPRPPALSRRRQLRRVVGRYRRPLSALLIGAAVTATLSSLAPARPRLVAVAVAARDLPGGEMLAEADLATTALPASAVPAGVFRGDDEQPVGRTLAAPVRRGEPITDARLVGPGLLTGTTGLAAVPVRLADAASAALLSPGDVVDVLDAVGSDGVGAVDTASLGAATGPPPGGDPGGATSDGASVAGARLGGISAVTVADAALVLAVPGTGTDAAGAADGALVVLAVPPSTARRLAAAQASGRLSVAVRAAARGP